MVRINFGVGDFVKIGDININEYKRIYRESLLSFQKPPSSIVLEHNTTSTGMELFLLRRNGEGEEEGEREREDCLRRCGGGIEILMDGGW